MGTVEVVLHVVILKGWERRDEEAMVKGYTQAPSLVTNCPAQTAGEEGVSDDRRFLENCAGYSYRRSASRGFSYPLPGEFNYGRQLEVVRHDANRVNILNTSMVGTCASGGCLKWMRCVRRD